MNESQLTGIILSGGKSSRMGKEKGLVDFQGKPLISYAIQLLEPIVDSIVIGANNELNAYREFGYPIVEDEIKGIGPIGGIFSTLKYTKTQRNVIVSCDMPFLEAELLKFIYEKMQDFDVLVASHGDNKVEPLCGIYSKNILPEIEDSIQKGNYKLMDFFKNIRFATVKIDASLPFYDEKLFYNINSPADIKI